MSKLENSRQEPAECNLTPAGARACSAAVTVDICRYT